MTLFLLAQSATNRNLGPVLLQLGLLIVAVLVLGLVILAVRKAMFKEDDAGAGGSLLDDLRGLRDSGEISEVEYDYLRKCIAARVAGKELPPRPPELEQVELRARPGFDLTGEPLPPEVLRAQQRRRRDGA